MKIRLSQKNQANWYVAIVYSLFIFGAEVRNGISEILFPINLIYLIVLLALLYINKKNISIHKMFIIVMVIMQSVIINILNSVETAEIFRSLLYYHVPCFILIINYDELKVDYNNLVRKVLVTFNLFIIIIFFIFIIDSLTNGLIMKNLVILTPNIAGWVPDNYNLFDYRYASYIGHYLATSELYVMFFLLNKCYKEKCNKYLLNKYLLYFVGILGVVSTGSKTGIILLTIAIVHTSFKGINKARGLVFLTIIYNLLEITGLSKIVFRRFFSEASLTTGRNEALTRVIESDEARISLLTGYGMKTVEILSTHVNYSQVTTAMEYPFINYLISYGWLSAFAYIYIMFISIVYNFIKKKQYYFAGSITIVFVNINTFNWLSSVSDAIIFYLLFVMLIKFISLIPNLDIV